MSKVVWHTTTSLDGFIAGPDDAMEWAFDAWEGSDSSRLADEVMHSTGAILAGRRLARRGEREVRRPAGHLWRQMGGAGLRADPSRLDHDVSDPGITLLTTELEDAVSTASEAAGDKNLEIFGANVAAQCLAEGLIDEMVVHIAPVLLGDGVRLYGEADDRQQVNLELVDRAESGRAAEPALPR